jgi:hypothetical protein
MDNPPLFMQEDDGRRYQALIDNQLIPITFFDPQGFLVAANTLAIKNMNQSVPIPSGIHLRSLIPSNAFEKAWDKFSEVVNTG